MTFSCAGRPQEQTILTFTNKSAAGQIIDLFLLDRRIKLPVEVFEIFLIPEHCSSYPTFNLTFFSYMQFILQNKLEELGVGKAIACRLL
jgi:hypothetical protein